MFMCIVSSNMKSGISIVYVLFFINNDNNMNSTPRFLRDTISYLLYEIETPGKVILFNAPVHEK